MDTARLRNEISEKLNVAHTAIHAYVLGEHGDSQFVAWSSSTCGGLSLIQDFEEFKDEKFRDEISNRTRTKAMEIIKSKGATYFGIAAVVSSICETVLLDRKNVRPLSVFVPEWKVCISYPVVLGRKGVLRILPLSLNEKEIELMAKSASYLKDIISEYEPKLNH